MKASAKPIIFIDGKCHLCHGAIRFIAPRDKGHFYFASLQGKLAQKLIGDSVEQNSVMVFVQDKLLMKSTAALYIGERLIFPWNYLSFSLKIIPKAWRDYLYDVIARHRYQWFGQQDHCQFNPQISRDRILD